MSDNAVKRPTVVFSEGISRRFSNRLGRSDRSQLSIWFWEIDRIALSIMLILMAIGLIAIAAASPATAERLSTDRVTLDPLYFFYRQLRWLAVGIPVMIVVSMLPKKEARRLAILAMIGFGILLMLVPILGESKNGAQRWIGYGLTIQPSEFLKPAFAVTIAWILSLKVRDPSLPVTLFSGFLFASVACLLMMQPNLGATIVFFGIWFVLVLLAGLSAQIIALTMAGGVGGLLGAYFLYPTATARINSWLFGGDSFDQVSLAHKTLTNGGFIGAGPGLGTAKFRLPEAHTDYIFSVVGEEFGLFACAAIAIIYLILIGRVLMRLQEENDLFTSLAVTGLVAQIGGQAMINMAVNLQLFPSKGMTLPFVSYGGSSMIALCFAAGLLLAFSRRNPYLDRSLTNRDSQGLEWHTG